MAMKLFENKDMGVSVKVILDVNGDPWFKAKDIATALGYTNTVKAIGDHVHPDDRKYWKEFNHNELFPPEPLSNSESESTTATTTFNRNEKNIVFINESGVYSLIMRSKK